MEKSCKIYVEEKGHPGYNIYFGNTVVILVKLRCLYIVEFYNCHLHQQGEGYMIILSFCKQDN